MKLIPILINKFKSELRENSRDSTTVKRAVLTIQLALRSLKPGVLTRSDLNLFIRISIIWMLAPIAIFANTQIKTLHASLDPSSISKQLAFYQLYPETPEGQKALSCAWKLLGTNQPKKMALPTLDLQPLIALVNRQPLDEPPTLDITALDLIDSISSHLHNRKLQGHFVWNKDDLVALPVEQIDLSRALLLQDISDPIKIRQYEATLDLMALQVSARLNQSSTGVDKINAINDFIFHEMRYRFPPHSIWTDDVDLYTFLPAVMDSRKGVCLGVSILYLSLAQRLNLPLEIVTPPGHIYIRYRQDSDHVINIETTARGIDVPSKSYLSIHTKSLQTRNIKEVIGLAFINQAAVCWQKENHTEAVNLYEKALPYLPNDPLLNMLLGYNYLFVGQIAKGKQLLEQITNTPIEGSLTCETLPIDYLSGKTNVDGIKAVFFHVDETRSSILDKQKQLESILNKYPKFRDGWFHLAVTHFQLNNHTEALSALEKLHKLDNTQPTVEYYLAQLKLMRYAPSDAWKHFEQAQNILAKHNHKPPCMRALYQALQMTYPHTNYDK